MNFKWKINGSKLVIHNKKTGEIALVDKKTISAFEAHLDCSIQQFLNKK